MSERPDPWANVTLTPVVLPGARITIAHPASAEELIFEADFELDERIPYWADIWPSSRVLAEALLRRRPAAPLRCLELGCGVGLVATAAVIAGYDVTATDYYRDALAFAEQNVQANTGTALHTVHIDWNILPESLEKYDLVVASDVLYEQRCATELPAVLRRTVKTSGSVLIADPGRLPLPDFLSGCRAVGLRLVSREVRPVQDAGREITVHLMELRPGTPAD